MADPFNPKFVDLVRNYTTTLGTSDFTLGPAVNGFTGLAAALTVGDRFYYSCIGVDKPAEREVGRGTLTSDGKVVREPISGSKTSFSTGTKAIALVAAAEWFTALAALPGQIAGIGTGGAKSVADRAEMAALSTTTNSLALLRESGREGVFVWSGANLSAMVTADTRQGIYVAPASAPTGASGAWVRKFDGPAFTTWFGVSTTATPTANATAFAAALATLKAMAFTGGGYGPGGTGLHTPAGNYQTDQSISITHIIRFTGDFAGMFGGGGTLIEFTAVTDGITVSGDATGRAFIDGLWLKNTNAATVIPGSGKYGLKVRRSTTGQNMYITGFEHGIDCFGNSGAVPYSNCNGSIFNNIALQNNVWGTWADGPDANNIKFNNVSCITNALGGHLDSSFLGNIYDGGDLSSNGRYSSTYKSNCTVSGHVYMCMMGQEAWCSTNAPTGLATSNQGWIYIAEGVAQPYQPAWSTGQTWYFSSSYAMDPNNNNARSTFRDIYVEPDHNPAIMTWPGISYVGSDTGSILTPSGAGYSATIRAGYGGTLQMGNISTARVDCRGLNVMNATGSGYALLTDPLNGEVYVGGTVDPGNSTNQNFTINSWGAAAYTSLVFARNSANASAIQHYQDGTLYYFTNQGSGKHYFYSLGAPVLDITSSGLNLASGKAIQLNGTTVIDASRNGSFANVTASGTVAATGAVTGSNLSGTHSGSSSGTNSGDQTITLTGDVTGSGTVSFTATIGAGAVSLNKMANLAASSILGNNTGAAATPAALTPAQTKTLLAINAADVAGLATVASSGSAADLLSGTLPAARLPALTGDVTTSAGSAATALAASAVTYAKIQNVAASRLLGNPSGAGAAPSEIALAGGLAFSGSALTAAGALTPTSVASSGAVTSSAATAGVGYATGAGGAVTQATSKATGVTLNKAAGQVTMNAAALAAAAVVEFTVTNSAVAATDTVNLNLASGAATTTAYRYWISGVAAGSFKVCVENRSAGSLSEALVLNFAVVKAVNA